MATKPILVDSNILIYAINSASPKHIPAQDFLQVRVGQLAITPQNVFECLRVLTHQKFPKPMTPSAAAAAVGSITKACRLVLPSYTAYHVSLELIQKYHLSGDKIFDATLAAAAIAAGIHQIATDNIKDFAVFEEVEAINPFI